MAVLKEQISYRARGPIANNEDWHDLCYDTDTKEFYIEHRWDYVSPAGDVWAGTEKEPMPSRLSSVEEHAREKLLERAKAERA